MANNKRRESKGLTIKPIKDGLLIKILRTDVTVSLPVEDGVTPLTITLTKIDDK